ncbi:class I adenylate-forming enzyme family protein [Bradyrhizobium erythrophlei]|uniref:3-methylmercaptopropionyl-CoA ligase n=1 Tax=Bradyrhizobium erythrophlei TaxID=1437360 RepID=A0A1H4X143_9BRAD|nr:class I adenylate-forming enzyme family protein [Bradyrhizobium erythrophlei]SEC98658.1 long-chain acyl-CoA synthetase [Bradyrhizobium erythrophlei]
MKDMELKETWPVMSLAEAHVRLTRPGAPYEMNEVVVGGFTMRSWKNVPPTLRDLFLLGRGFGPRTFVVYEDDRTTYESFARATLAFAAELQRQGVKKGDRVALAMRNLPEWPVVFFATVIIGAIVAPLNAWWSGPELEYGFNDSGAKVAVVDAERYDRLAAHLETCTSLSRVFVARQEDPHDVSGVLDPRAVRLESVIGSVATWDGLPLGVVPDVLIEPEDDASIFYTSGTTGKPKGALATHRNICTSVGTNGFANARASLRRGADLPKPDPQQRTTLLAIPLFHVTGCISVLAPLVVQGSKLVLMRRWDVETAMKLIEREKVDATGGVPTIAWQLVEHPERNRYDLSSLKSLSYGGAPSAPELVRKIKEVFPAAVPGTGWGMTETSATLTSHFAEEYEDRPGSCGPAAAVGELKVVGSDGETLGVNAVGELWVKGPQVVKGYWNKPDETAKTFVDGWVKTGDLARLDEDGFCYIVDRAKDMLIRGGENIYCVEVENILYEHPAVVDAALVGIPHRTLGEVPAAVVTLRHGTTVSEDELRGFVAHRLASFKVPVAVAFWSEALPRNANGKLLKGELRKLFASHNSSDAKRAIS